MRNWRIGGVAPGRVPTIRSNTSGTSAAATSRQMPPARKSTSSRHAIASAGVSSARNPALAASPRATAQFATCNLSNRSRPRSGGWGRPSLRIQSFTTVSETPNDSAIWIRFKYMVRESVSFDRFLRGDICGMRRLWRSHELWRYLNKPDIFVGLEPYLYRISIFFSRQPGSADLLLWRMAIATPPTNHEPVPIGHPAPPP